jgi:hypothetical protein
MDKADKRALLTRSFARLLGAGAVQLPARAENGSFPFLVAFLDDRLDEVGRAVRSLGGDASMFVFDEATIDGEDAPIPMLVRLLIDVPSEGNVVQMPVRLASDAVVGDMIDYFANNEGTSSATFTLGKAVASVSEPHRAEFGRAA